MNDQTSSDEFSSIDSISSLHKKLASFTSVVSLLATCFQYNIAIIIKNREAFHTFFDYFSCFSFRYSLIMRYYQFRGLFT